MNVFARLTALCTFCAAVFAVPAVLAQNSVVRVEVMAEADLSIERNRRGVIDSAATNLVLSSDALQRALIRFPEAQLGVLRSEFLASNDALARVRLRLFVVPTSSGKNPEAEEAGPTGESTLRFGAYELERSWRDGAATWDCSVDPLPRNDVVDCTQDWPGGATTERSSVVDVERDDVEGGAWIEIDVTESLLDRWRSETAEVAHPGWLIAMPDVVAVGSGESTVGASSGLVALSSSGAHQAGEATLPGSSGIPAAPLGRRFYVSSAEACGFEPRLVFEMADRSDTVPPTVVWTVPERACATGLGPRVEIAFSDDHSGVDFSTLEVIFAGQSLEERCQQCGTALRCDLPELGAGPRRLEVRVSDLEGNETVQSRLVQGVFGTTTWRIPFAELVGIEDSSDSSSQPSGGSLAPGVGGVPTRRTLVRVEPEVLTLFNGAMPIEEAHLELRVAAIDRGSVPWASSDQIQAARLLQGFEVDASWTCASGTEGGACEVPWQGGRSLLPSGAPAPLADGTSRLEVDVSADLDAFRAGDPALGWLVAATVESGSSGPALDFFGLESSVDQGLVLRFRCPGNGGDGGGGGGGGPLPDETPPEVRIVAPLQGSFSEGVVTETLIDLLDLDSGVDESTLQVLLDDVAVLGCVLADSGAGTGGVRVTCALQPAVGAHLLEASVADQDGNLGTDQVAFDVVAIPVPSLLNIAPPSGTLLGQSSVILTGVTVNASEVEIDGTLFPVTDNAFSAGPLSLTEGANEFTLRALGNGLASAPQAHEIVSDTLPPAIVILQPLDQAQTPESRVEVVAQVVDPHLTQVAIEGVVVAASPDGMYRLLLDLSVGENALEVSASDVVGNQSAGVVRVESLVEVPAPIVVAPSLADGACLRSEEAVAVHGRLSAAGAIPAEVTVVVHLTRSDGSVESLPASVDVSAGTWQVAGVLVGSTDGLASVEVVVTTPGGSQATTAVWPVDAGPPVLQLLLAGAPFPGLTTGPAVPGSASVLLNRAVRPVAAVADGATNAPPPFVLELDSVAISSGHLVDGEGDHLVELSATDCGGRRADLHARFTIDTTPPTLLSTEPVASALLLAAAQGFTGLSSNDLVLAWVDGVPAVVAGSSNPGAFELPSFSSLEGDNLVEVRLQDAAGNLGEYEVRFEVDTGMPSVAVFESGVPLVAGTVFARSVRPEIEFAPSSATVTATVDGNPFLSGAEVTSDGDHVLTAVVVDQRGRTASVTSGFRIRLSGAPSIEITSPTEGAVINGTSTPVSGTVFPPGLPVTVNGISATVVGSSWSVPVVPLLDESEILLATTVDELGRSASDQVAVHSLLDGPQVVITDPSSGTVTNVGRIDVSGVVVGGAAQTVDGMVRVVGPGGSEQNVSIGPGGGFLVRDVELNQGPNSIRAEVSGLQGVLRSDQVQVTLDSLPPQWTITADGGVVVDGAEFSEPLTLLVVANDPPEFGALESSNLRINGASLAFTAAGANGHDHQYEFEVDTPGGFLLTAFALDLAGNEARRDLNFALGGGACALSGIDPVDGTVVAEPTLSVGGTVALTSAVMVAVGPLGGVATDFPARVAEGTFVAADLPLVVGVNTVRVTCFSVSGASASETLTVERLGGDGPNIELFTPTEGALLLGPNTMVGGSATPGSVSVNGQAADRNGTSAFTSEAALVEGPNVLTARVVDVTGRSALDRALVVRDSRGPPITIDSPVADQVIGPDQAAGATVDVVGRVDLSEERHLEGVRIESAGTVVDAVVDAAGNFFAPSVLVDGSGADQLITAVARDTLGNEGDDEVLVSFDGNLPVLHLEEPNTLVLRGEGNDQPIDIVGLAVAEPGAEISINGIALDPATLAWVDGADGRRSVAFSTTVPAPNSNGTFSLVVRVEELDGDRAEERRLVRRSDVGPEVVELIPGDGEVDVSPTSLLLALFTEPVAQASLMESQGLSLVRVSTGQSIAGQFFLAGPAVAFAPAAPLAFGEDYLWAAGDAVVDLFGNALTTAVEARFSVALDSVDAVPVLVVDPLPETFCATEILVSGQAPANARLRVVDGELSFFAVAVADGRFLVRVPVVRGGYHLLRISIVDRNDVLISPVVTTSVRIDCNAPSVVSADLDRDSGTVLVTFSEPIDGATLAIGLAVDAFRMSDADDDARTPQSAVLSSVGAPGEEAVFELRLDQALDAWWRGRPVRLEVRDPAADVEGNVLTPPYERVFLVGAGELGDGFLFGEVFDDSTGRPLQGVSVELFEASARLPQAAVNPLAPTASALSEGRGRFTLAGSPGGVALNAVPAGRYALRLHRDGYTGVWRRVTVVSGRGIVPFDSRLTPLAPLLGAVDGTGGSFGVDGLVLTLPRGAFADGEPPAEVTLTALSGQGLADLLPLGWTPVAAVDVRLSANTAVRTQEESLAFDATLELSLSPWLESARPIVAALYDIASGQWIALEIIAETVGSAGERIAHIALPVVGTVVVVVADEESAGGGSPPTPALAERLEGVEETAIPMLLGEMSIDPPVIGPSGRAEVTVVARSADNAVWPSGLAVQAFLEERLRLVGGGQVQEAPFSADLVLYRPQLDASVLGGSPEAAVGVVRFQASPSPQAARVLLDVGFEEVRLFPFPEELERGQLVGAPGGSVFDEQSGRLSAELRIPPGALSEVISPQLDLLGAGELAALDPVEGYDVLAAVRVQLEGRTLLRPATLIADLAEVVQPDAGVFYSVLARRVDQPADDGAGYVRVVGRAARSRVSANLPETIRSSPDLAGTVPLTGVTREGLFVFLQARTTLGFVSGRALAPIGSGLSQVRVQSEGLGSLDLTEIGGQYAVPVVAGSARAVRGFLIQSDLQAERPVEVAAGQHLAPLDLALTSLPPGLVALQPAADATELPLDVAVSVQLDEPIAVQSLGPGTLRVELLERGSDGGLRPSGAFVRGTVGLSSDGTRIVFAAELALFPGRHYQARFDGAVYDLDGVGYSDGPVSWRFSTAASLDLGGDVDPERFHVLVPENGTVEVFGDPGALPATLPGQLPWLVSPQVTRTGELAMDPVTQSLSAALDGSFAGTVGRPEAGFGVALEDRVWVRVFDPSGDLAAIFPLGPMTTADGRGFVVQPDEEAFFVSSEGVAIRLREGSFARATLVTTAVLPVEPLELERPLGLVEAVQRVSVEFEGRALLPLEITVPSTTSLVAGAMVVFAESVDLPFGRRWNVLAIGEAFDEEGATKLSNRLDLLPGLPSSRANGSAGLLLGSEARQLVVMEEGLSFGSKREFFDRAQFALRDPREIVFFAETDFGRTDRGFISLMLPVVIPSSSLSGGGVFEQPARMVGIPPVRDRDFHIVMPVIVDQPFTIRERDQATGWILSEREYDPVSGDVVVPLGPVGTVRAPILVGASPVQLLPFPAPGTDGTLRIRLDIEAANRDGAIGVGGVEGFELAKGTVVQVYDLAPTNADPPLAAVRYGERVLASDSSDWQIQGIPRSNNLLLVLGPADLSGRERFEFTFDQVLEDLSSMEPQEIATFEDLGVANPATEGEANSAPIPVPFRVVHEPGALRFVLEPLGALPADHRYRLRLKRMGIRADNGVDEGIPIQDGSPVEFKFATAQRGGQPFGTLGAGATAEDLGSARDLVLMGNLLIGSSSASGYLVTFDVSDPTSESGLRLHSTSVGRGFKRSMATDGHGRLHYSTRFGALWAVKTARLEDMIAAEEDCGDTALPWAEKCFDSVQGSAQVAFSATDGTGASLGRSLPQGSPKQMQVLTQDEEGEVMVLEEFYRTYLLDPLPIPDANGFVTFDVPVKSTHIRHQSGLAEPSRPDDLPEPASPEATGFRSLVCGDEEAHDRYQRVTVDNLTTGQSWSADIENPWQQEDGDGTGNLVGVRARRGDAMQVRYNVRSLGYLAILGGGTAVVDLNRFYRLPASPHSVLGTQCGRLLGISQGETLELPACVDSVNPGLQLEGARQVLTVAVHGETGCSTGDEVQVGGLPEGEAPGGEEQTVPPLFPTDEPDSTCRGSGAIHVYNPVLGFTTVETQSPVDQPGTLGSNNTRIEPLLRDCVNNINGDPVRLSSVELANDNAWFDFGLRLSSGTGGESSALEDPTLVVGDLLFVAMGEAGVLVYDVSDRNLEESQVVGRLDPNGRFARRLNVDKELGLLFVGGFDTSEEDWELVVDVYDLRAINGGPGAEINPRPIATLQGARFSGYNLPVDPSGSGLIWHWNDEGPQAVPFDNPQFRFQGLYLTERERDEQGNELPEEPLEEGEIAESELRATSRFVPLGVAVEKALDDDLEAAERVAETRVRERRGTGAFKLRVALPGSLGEELQVKVQSLRMRPEDQHLGLSEVGGLVSLPGGPGWPAVEATVTLRRLGREASAGGAGEDLGDQLSAAFSLYESVETILLLADPRATRDYQLQTLESMNTPASRRPDEASQCRRCEWPSYLPDPDSELPEHEEALDNIVELLAGRYVRAFLSVDETGSSTAQEATSAALAFFAERGGDYLAPAGIVTTVGGGAAPVPSPMQVSLAEPAQRPARFAAGASVSVVLVSGEALMSEVDYAVHSRSIPFQIDRSYRSNVLGYGPLGATGWSSSLFARLREIETTGDVEYHDGRGSVWRFLAPTADGPPGTHEEDDLGSYWVPKGLYLRLQKLPELEGWRLLDPQHNVMRFDVQGRLAEISDRHRRAGDVEKQGSTHQFFYDGFSQLALVRDDLQREYTFEYHQDVGSPKYGLLEKVTDFAGRTTEYQYSDDRELLSVLLPEVTNQSTGYQDFSYAGANRPSLEYTYGPSSAPAEEHGDAILHGAFGALRLASARLPKFLATSGGGQDVPIVRLTYQPATGRVRVVSHPTPENLHPVGGGVRFELAYQAQGVAGGAAEAVEVVLTEPWGHERTFDLEDGRLLQLRERLAVEGPAGAIPRDVERSFEYAEDGRLLTGVLADGGRLELAYGDVSSPTRGVPPPGLTDRLQKPNVLNALRSVGDADPGTATYTSLSTSVDYEADNLPDLVRDGLSRPIGLAVPNANESARSTFATEGVGTTKQYDAFGRVSGSTGDGEGPTSQVQYHPDENDNSGAGLVRKVSRQDAFSVSFEYDDQFNVEVRETSQGTREEYVYDELDRVVRSVAGLGAGVYESVGGVCGFEGAESERAFDAAGHVVRDRRRQQFVRENGALGCRWVESKYRYNARRQLISVARDQLSEPSQPGAVSSLSREIVALEYDEFGRLFRRIDRNAVSDDLVTEHRYDDASRLASSKVGDGGEQRLGYDEKNRTVLRTDGHEGVWRGRFDAWDRLYREEPPTGAVIRRSFDQANNLTGQVVFDGDPDVGSAAVLSEVETRYNSFGAVDCVMNRLDESTGQTLATLREYDASGRITAIVSGEATSHCMITGAKRRELEIVYEPSGGRVLRQLSGGAANGPAEAEDRLVYGDLDTPWPVRLDQFESIPDTASVDSEGLGPLPGTLVATWSIEWLRDALGRPVRTSRSDGRVSETTYDLLGPAILQRTGSGSVTGMGFDGAGREIVELRPNGRGATVRSYDLDGRPLLYEARNQGTDPWRMSYAYDRTGRVILETHADGTSEGYTYLPDHLVATKTTRQGVELEYVYDSANRLTGVMPTQDGALPSGLAALDQGDGFTYDELSRRLSSRRGRTGSSGFDVHLGIQHPEYDLGSRPTKELLGNRDPLAWTYDVWSRPTESLLPSAFVSGAVRAGLGSGFLGYQRAFDTLDRLVDVASAGSQFATSAAGANWRWGGSGRLYAVSTKAGIGPLQTEQRLGYQEGAGVELFEAGPSSPWQLGALIWGSGETGALSAPASPWAQFAFGWRGGEDQDGDILKLGRKVVRNSESSDSVAAGQGWALGYDAAERAAIAIPGEGSTRGAAFGSAPQAAFRQSFGTGDELLSLIDEVAGVSSVFTTGAYGRILSRDGTQFSYDQVGRRIQDDRYDLLWNWRGELVQAEVKPAATLDDGTDHPYQGHQVQYRFDALGRMTTRLHYGVPASPGTQRPFIERRDYLWENQFQLGEIGSGAEDGSQVRWRKLFVPGPQGLDDAVQMMVEDLAGDRLLYTMLTDEQGSVLSLLSETEIIDPARPNIPVRYHYKPFGQAVQEAFLRIAGTQYRQDIISVDGSQQEVQDPTTHRPGTLQIAFRTPVEASTLFDATDALTGLVLEHSQSGSPWQPVPANQWIFDLADDAQSFRALPLDGWTKGRSYRLRLLTELRDLLGRGPPPGSQAITWLVPEFGEWTLELRTPVVYESVLAASDTVGGRFPGGQNKLFHGAWTDPVTGFAYHRARWYDPRNAAFLSEDPLGDIDSPNLYAYVANSPFNGQDPLGLTCRNPQTVEEARGCDQTAAEVTDRTVRNGAAYLRGIGEGLNSMPKRLLQAPGDLWELTLAASEEANYAFSHPMQYLGDVFGSLKELPGEMANADSEELAGLFGQAASDLILGYGASKLVPRAASPASATRVLEAPGTTVAREGMPWAEYMDEVLPSGGRQRRYNPPARSGSTHGNVAGDQPATLYERFDAEGSFLKHGVSQDPGRRYTQRELDGGFLLRTQTGSRREILAVERELVETNPGPLNKEPWAGVRKQE